MSVEPHVEGVEDDLPSDRASASIGGAVAGSAERKERSRDPVRGPFDAIQRWMSGAIISGDVAFGGRPLEDLITPSARLSAADRLGIYQHGYKARLMECVRDDFRVLARALPRFDAIAARYVDEHPSRSWNLVPYTERFAAFLDRVEPAWLDPLGLGVARDVARLEWAMVEVSHAPAAPPLDLARLGSLAPEAWPRLAFRPSLALRVLELDHPILPLYAAVARGEALPPIARAWSAVATWRQNGRVWRMSLTRATCSILMSLAQGITLENSLSQLDEGTSDDVMRWFSEWVSCGFFAEILFPDQPAREQR